MYQFDLQKEIDEVKRELTDLIVSHLQDLKIEPQVAQQQAAEFLSILPIKDQQDLLVKLRALGDKYMESREVYLKTLTKIYEMDREEALTQMRNAIKLGNIDHAIAVAKAMQSK